MLKLILGRSKSGKTEYVRNLLSALALNGERNLLMLVPDQQTFDTEKAFLEILGPKNALNVKVLGFSRLCDYIFEETGYVPGILADDSVKALLMSIALEDTADHMRLYSEKALSPQLLNMMLQIRHELMNNKITPDILSGAEASGNALLASKLHDVNLALSAYDALLTTSFEDPEGEISIACDLLLKNPVFKDYIICVDSYLSFSEPEFDILAALMSCCSQFIVTLSDDAQDGENSIFEPSHKTADRLRAMAKEAGIGIEPFVCCDYNEFFTSDVLSHIEKYSFRNTSPEFTADASDLQIYSAKNIYDEADFVARNIRRLVQTSDYRYSDIAVVSRNIASYSGILDSALELYDISYFMDSPGRIHSKPLTKLISACFDCVTEYFHKDAVLSVLKSGLTCVDVLDVSLFENYIFTWNISGSKFHKEFTANPRGFADEFTSDDLLELSKVENVRKLIIPALTDFRDKIRDTTAEAICKALYSLLLDLGVDKQISSLCNKLDAQGEHHLSEEQLRLWQMFIDTVNRTVKVIGNRKVAPKRFAELLNLQFTAQDISFIPHAADQVTVGDIDRLRLSSKKVVFVIGAVEGEFPRTSTAKGIFTGSEREMLSDAGILCDVSAQTQALTEDYLCYYALTSASHKLFVSYPGADLKGAVIYPSKIITELSSLCPHVHTVNFSDVPVLDLLWSSKASFGVYAQRASSQDELTVAMSNYYSTSDEFKSSEKALKRAIARKDFSITNPENAQKLFGKNMYLSASQVEKYHLCRFMYFCTYGLRLKERKTAQIDAMEYGSFVHYILEHFLKKYSKQQMVSLSDEVISDDIEYLLNQYANEHFGGTGDKTERFLYLYSRVALYVHKLVNHLIEELSQSSFTPEAFELDIGRDVPAYSLTLPTGQTVTIRGKVDRADLMRKDGKTYIRIVDYKTGSKVFDLSDIMYGLNLQMLIYLSALTKDSSGFNNETLIPAGVLYMPSMVPVINAAFDDSAEKILAERNKKLRMNGLILRDMDVIGAMERECQGVYIPVSSKGESVKGTDNLASLEEFGAVFAHIDRLIADMATELLSGKVEAVPAKGGYDACEYCPYKASCGHKDTDKQRTVFKLDRAEIMRDLGIKDEEVAP